MGVLASMSAQTLLNLFNARVGLGGGGQSLVKHFLTGSEEREKERVCTLLGLVTLSNSLK